MSEPNRILGMHFFTSQDRMKGGPDETLCAEGYTARINGKGLDLHGHRELLASLYGAFPDLNHVIEDTVADEEKVAVRYVLHGTHQGEYAGVAPTGKRISIEGIAILSVEDGRITELRGLFDQALLLKELGG